MNESELVMLERGSYGVIGRNGCWSDALASAITWEDDRLEKSVL